MGAIALMHRLSPHDFERAREMLQAADRARAAAGGAARRGSRSGTCCAFSRAGRDDPQAEARSSRSTAPGARSTPTRTARSRSPIDGLVHTNLLKRLDVAQERYELALRVNPNDSLAWLLKGTLHAFKGEGRLARRVRRGARCGCRRSIRMRYFYDSLAATAALSAGNYARAIELAERSLRANRTHTSTLRALAIAQWQLRRQSRMRARPWPSCMRLEPTLTIANYLERSPEQRLRNGKSLVALLRQAGVPE